MITSSTRHQSSLSLSSFEAIPGQRTSERLSSFSKSSSTNFVCHFIIADIEVYCEFCMNLGGGGWGGGGFRGVVHSANEE